MAEYQHDEHGSQPRGGMRGATWLFWAFIVIALYFIVTEHRAHAVQFLPFALLLACPILHLLHGHGGHGKGKGEKR